MRSNKLIPILALVITFSGINAQAQKYFTRDGFISFFSTTPVEDIKANNSKVTCVLDSKSGAVEFAALMKAFEFKKALMEEHFNENYVESSTYPKSTFKGKVENIKEINFSKDGVYPAKVTGDLTIHGETKNISSEGTIEVKGENVVVKSEFYVSPEDYAIEIPGIVREKIAKQILVTVDVNLAPYNR